MDKGTENDFSEQSSASASDENKLKSEDLETVVRYSEFSNMETSSSTSPIIADGSPISLFEENIPTNSITVKNDSIGALATKVVSLESLEKLVELGTEVEGLLESINLQKEETGEMLDMITRAKEKLYFLNSNVEDFVKSLQEIPKNSDENCKGSNTYLKNLYWEKLVEFAFGILDKIRKSIKDLEADYEMMKQLEKETVETFENIPEFEQISDPCMAKIGKKTVGKLKVAVEHLVEELYLLKSKQLPEIEKVSYVETDIEMLFDLHRRSSDIQNPNNS